MWHDDIKQMVTSGIQMFEYSLGDVCGEYDSLSDVCEVLSGVDEIMYVVSGDSSDVYICET